MQGLILLATFIVMAVVSTVLAITVGLVIDRLPRVHDTFSLMAFFGTLVLLLPVGWVIAVRLTEPKHAA